MGFAVVVVAVMVVALVVGELLHRRRPMSHDEELGGFRLDVLAGSGLTLAVIMCSFMLAVSYSAFDSTNRDAGAEAGAIAGVYEAAGLLSDRTASAAMQQDVICYTRALVSDEWPRLGTGQPAASPTVEHWRRQLGVDIRSVVAEDQQSALSAVRTADVDRTATRQRRLVTSQRQTPIILYILLLVVSAAAILSVTAFTVRGLPDRLRAPIIVTLTVLLAATVYIISDLDHPFSGPIAISADYLAGVAANSASDYQAMYGTPVQSCDGAGRPTA